MNDLIAFFDAEGFEDQLVDTRGMAVFLDMIRDIFHCISDVGCGLVVEYEEIRDFISSKNAFLCCTDAGYEIIMKKMPGKRPFKIVSVRELGINNCQKSFSIH